MAAFTETSREHLAAAVAPFDQDVTREREQQWWPPPPLPSTGQQCSHPYHRPLFAFIVPYAGTMTYRLTSKVALHRPPPPNCIGECYSAFEGLDNSGIVGGGGGDSGGFEGSLERSRPTL
jgi:hypothetical protein